MRIIKFLYKVIVALALFIALILTFNLFGFELLSPYMFIKYEYQRTYSDIKNYEDVIPIQNGIAVVYRGKIGTIKNGKIVWTKIPYQDHKTISDGVSGLVIAKEKNYLHVIAPSGQEDILYPMKIRKAITKNGKTMVILENKDENHIILYDSKMNIILSISPNEKVIDADFYDNTIFCILKSKEDGKVAIAFANKEGIYKSKIIDQDITRCYTIKNYLLIYHNKSLDICNYDMKKLISIRLQGPPEYVEGTLYSLYSHNTVIAYNEILDKFVVKKIEKFDNITAKDSIILTNIENEIRIYSTNLNKLKTLKIHSFGFKKAIINKDKLYYIYSDRIEVYQERW